MSMFLRNAPPSRSPLIPSSTNHRQEVSGMFKSELQDRIAYAIAKMWKGKDCYGEGAAIFYYNDLDIYHPVGCIAFVGVGATIAGMAKSYRRLLSITSTSPINNRGIGNIQRFSLSEWVPFISLPLALLDANVPLQKFKYEMKRSELKSTIRFNAWIHELLLFPVTCSDYFRYLMKNHK